MQTKTIFSGEIKVKKINWKILNWAFWIEIILSYVLPFRVVDDFQYKVGFPIPFITVYDRPIEVNPLMSMHLNPLGLVFNGFIIYFIILFAMRAYEQISYSTEQ
jgi:hypothetical protein